MTDEVLDRALVPWFNGDRMQIQSLCGIKSTLKCACNVAGLHISYAYQRVVVMRTGTNHEGDGGAYLSEKPGYTDTPGRKNQ